MLNKAGGAGVQVTAYTQTLPDIEARVGSKSKAEQMLGNFNTVVMLRVLNESTAKLLIEKTNKVNVSDIATFLRLQRQPGSHLTGAVPCHRAITRSVAVGGTAAHL